MASHHDAGGKSPGWRYRPWAGLHMRPLNVEKGAKRFSPAADLIPPHASTWRNNLVALSQRRNLLFAAYGHQIYVWEPAGSSQVLGSKPEMIITPVMRNPQSQGYIAPLSPHAINSILVDDLGREEVLLLVTDSGNVSGYRVEAIVSALKRDHKRPLDGSQIDPFFVEYVEASAWGLAIHKFARLIAVTANTGLITVFAFALVNPASERSRSSDHPLEEDLSDSDQTWLEIKNSSQFVQLQQLMPDKHRTRNIKLTYTGHFTNIPSISFLNCDLDPNGTWMVSTDIDNKLLVWKIWESLGPFNVFHFNSVSFKSFQDAWYNDTERGWAVIALDPRSFHPLKDREYACGGRPQRHVTDSGTVLDLTRLSAQVPRASQMYNYFPPSVKPEPEQPVLPDMFGPDCLIGAGKGIASSERERLVKNDPKSTQDSDFDMSQDSGEHTEDASGNPSVADPLSSADTHADSFDPEELDDYSEIESDEDSEAEFPTYNLPQTTGNNRARQTNGTPRQPVHGPLTTAEFLQSALFEAVGGELPISIGQDTRVGNYDNDAMDDDYSESEEAAQPENEAQAYEIFDQMLRNSFTGEFDLEEPPEQSIALPPAPACIYSHFPIIQFSQTDIRLVPYPFAPHESVFCNSPLRQPFTHPIVSIRASDRFNMVKYIPEHGIIVAASQKGRAAVISLTESKAGGVSFRIDWIVPFEDQEKYGDRPLIPLLGMSVSPIQGFEMPPDIPYIPRDINNSDDITFHYKFINHDADNDNSYKSTSYHNAKDTNRMETDSGNEDRTQSQSQETDDKNSTIPQLTLPECHAKASRIYKPDERWRGWYPSRRYRLLLMYSDHTIMSYEFWYDWASPCPDSGLGSESGSFFGCGEGDVV